MIIILVLGSVGAYREAVSKPTETSKTTTATPKSEPTPTSTPKAESTPSPTPEPTKNPEEQAKADLEGKIKEYAKKYEDTSIKQISINENLGTDKPDDYIALIHLSFDRKNTPGGAKGMLDLYASDLAANLAKSNNVTEVTVFWEVSYIKKEANIAKFNYTRKGDKMFLQEDWYDGNIFK